MADYALATDVAVNTWAESGGNLEILLQSTHQITKPFTAYLRIDMKANALDFILEQEGKTVFAGKIGDDQSQVFIKGNAQIFQYAGRYRMKNFNLKPKENGFWTIDLSLADAELSADQKLKELLASMVLVSPEGRKTVMKSLVRKGFFPAPMEAADGNAYCAGYSLVWMPRR